MFNTALSAIELQMPLTDALLLSLLGMAIVFGVLIILMGIIWIMGKLTPQIPKISEKMSKAFKKKKAGEDIQAEEASKAKGTCGELVLINTEERDAAMIMAIVADSTGIPLNELRFKSIKRVDE
ncbi:MAG: OadG family protein [Clostridia bacterium]|nr:OadG family protein [Clostridia bacterium]MBO7326187.1 OadG family protein [Clostridia bacterium]